MGDFGLVGVRLLRNGHGKPFVIVVTDSFLASKLERMDNNFGYAVLNERG